MGHDRELGGGRRFVKRRRYGKDRCPCRESKDHSRRSKVLGNWAFKGLKFGPNLCIQPTFRSSELRGQFMDTSQLIHRSNF